MTNYNAKTEAVYSVANQESLETFKELFELTSNEWAGFNQWKELGRQVKKGAKGCGIKMVCKKKFEKNGEEVKKTVCKTLYVFNYEMTEEIK
jgi:antirestriction protein ArdC